MMGHLNSFSASGGGNLNKNFPKIQMPAGLTGGGGMLKLQFNWYITGICMQGNYFTCNFTVQQSNQFQFFRKLQLEFVLFF